MIKNFKTLLFLITFVLLGSKTLYSQTSFWERAIGTYGSTPPSFVMAMTMDMSNGNILACAALGVYLYNGNSWTRKAIMLDIPKSIAIAPNGDIYLGTLGLYKLVNGENSWTLVFNFNHTIDNILITGSTDNYKVYFGTSLYGFFRPDGNGSWERANEGLDNSFGSISISSLALGANGDILYASASAVGRGGLYCSSDDGNNWNSISQGLGTSRIEDLAVVDSNTIFAVAAYGSARGVSKSTNGGANWEQVYVEGLNSSAKIIYNSKTGDIFVLDNTLRTVFRSTNLGDDWDNVTNGFLGHVEAFAFDPITGQTYLGTNTTVYRFVGNNTGGEISVKDPADVTGNGSNFLFQSSPNPIRSGYDATIRYRLNNAGQVNLTVYDILGREVAKLVDEYKPQGIHSVNFNTKNLASGVYFYKLRAHGYEGLKKMLIIR